MSMLCCDSTSTAVNAPVERETLMRALDRCIELAGATLIKQAALQSMLISAEQPADVPPPPETAFHKALMLRDMLEKICETEGAIINVVS